MVHVLTGANSYLLHAAEKKVKHSFNKTYGEFAIEVVDISELETGRIIDLVAAVPFLTEKRLVVMRGLAANKVASEAIESILSAVSDQTDLYIVEPKLDKRGVLYKTLKKQTELEEFAEIDSRDAPRWLVEEAKARGGSLSMADAQFLVSRVGAGQQLLMSELEKLLTYNTHVTKQAIIDLTEQTPQSNIFELIEAAFSGDLKKALLLYDDQRAQNAEPLAIEALFVWQLHALVLVKAAGQKSPDTVAAESGLSPYTAKKSAALAAKRTMAQLKQYVNELAKLEYAVKTTSVNADEMMKNYIVLLGQ